MPLNREDVLHVAKLARLELTPDEVEPMLRDLAQILDYVAELSELDTSAVAPTSQVVGELTPLRDDTLLSGLSPERALAEAPRRSELGFAVPGFVDES